MVVLQESGGGVGTLSVVLLDLFFQFIKSQLHIVVLIAFHLLAEPRRCNFEIAPNNFLNLGRLHQYLSLLLRDLVIIVLLEVVVLDVVQYDIVERGFVVEHFIGHLPLQNLIKLSLYFFGIGLDSAEKDEEGSERKADMKINSTTNKIQALATEPLTTPQPLSSKSTTSNASPSHS